MTKLELFTTISRDCPNVELSIDHKTGQFVLDPDNGPECRFLKPSGSIPLRTVIATVLRRAHDLQTTENVKRAVASIEAEPAPVVSHWACIAVENCGDAYRANVPTLERAKLWGGRINSGSIVLIRASQIGAAAGHAGPVLATHVIKQFNI
jgi:hypothetical protein